MEQSGLNKVTKALTKFQVGKPALIPAADHLSAAESRGFTGRATTHFGDRDFHQPAGTLFRVNRDYECHAYVHSEQANVQEETVDGNHTVSTCFGGGNISDGKLLSLAILHKIDQKNLKVYYANDAQGGASCSLCACHKFDHGLLLSASYQIDTCSDPVMEVELQQGNGSFKIDRNLMNGHQQLYIHSKTLLPAEILMRNSFTTNFWSDGSLGLEFELATPKSLSLSSTILFGLNGSKTLSVGGSQSIGNYILAESASTNFSGEQFISFEAKHKVSEQNDVCLKLTSSCFNNCEVGITASLFKQKNSWNWKYRLQYMGHIPVGSLHQMGEHALCMRCQLVEENLASIAYGAIRMPRTVRDVALLISALWIHMIYFCTTIPAQDMLPSSSAGSLGR